MPVHTLSLGSASSLGDHEGARLVYISLAENFKELGLGQDAAWARRRADQMKRKVASGADPAETVLGPMRDFFARKVRG